jgi:hypothetical protein
MLSYGALKLFPFWDSAAGIPLEQIVASLAPKTVKLNHAVLRKEPRRHNMKYWEIIADNSARPVGATLRLSD